MLITSPEKMRELNIEWRGEDLAASVLSFPQGESPGPERTLGDIAIRAGEEGVTDRMLTHGVLHLLGYNHDTVREWKKMEKLTDETLEAIR